MNLSARLQHAGRWMHQNQAIAFDRLQRWCNQNSWSHHTANLQAMAEMLVEDFAAIRLPLSCVKLPPLRLLSADHWRSHETGPALLFHHQPQAARRILLMIHYDTVYPTTNRPDQCERKGERLIGPGTADAKGGIAVLAMAVEAVLRFDLAPEIGISILLNPDEEIGSTASLELMSQLAPQFDAALVFEPTLPDGAMVAARKGSGNFCLTAHGRSAHAGRNPEEGRNAIVHLAKLIPEIESLGQTVDDTLLNIGWIEGGGPLNQVPDRASLQLNARVQTDVAMQRIETALGEIAARASFDDYRTSLVGEFHSPPKLVTPDIEQLQRRVEAAGNVAGRTIRWRDTGGACDGSKLAGLGVPNIDTMGVAGGGLHSSTEFCDLDSIVPAAWTVAAFLAEFGSPAGQP